MRDKPAGRLRPTAGLRLRAYAAACCVALLLALWAARFAASDVYPATVAQAQGWRARTPEAAAAAREAPLRATSVQLVVSRFSGNLSWVPGLVELMGVTEVTIYCKVRPSRAAAEFSRGRAALTPPRRQNAEAPPAAVPCTHVLPNVGNEGHTYLHHIVLHWETLPELLLLLPDTVEYGDKLKTWRRLKRSLAAHGGAIYYADDFTPVSGLRFVANWFNERFYGVNFPCRDHRRGGTDCVYFGHTDGVNPTGSLTPAQPSDWIEWLDAHLEGTRRFQIARCGWGNRGMVVVSRAAIRGHSKQFYANLVSQLERDVFPMAGMFVERLWRRMFLCSNMAAGGEGRGRRRRGGWAGGSAG